MTAVSPEPIEENGWAGRSLRRIAPWGVEHARAFHAAACSLCLRDRYNLVLHKHLGDVVNTLAAKACFEERYGRTLRVLVRPQHEFLMQMYGVEDYAVLDVDALVKSNAHLLKIYFGAKTPSSIDIDHLENYLFQALFPCVPIEGMPFVCENLTNDFFAFDRYWARRWAANMGIEDCRLAMPSRVPQLSSEAAAALSAIAPLQRIVLFAPEAVTAEEFGPDFWDTLAGIVESRGFTIVVNSKRIAVRHGVSAFSLGLSLADVVALGHACAYVFSLRSGLCDALVGIGKRLYAFYPAMLRREAYGLNRVHAGVPDTREICISDWTVDRCRWEGVDCTKPLQGYVDVLRRRHRLARLAGLLPFQSADNPRRSQRHRLELQAGSSPVFAETNTENLPKDQAFGIAGVVLVRKSFHKTFGGRRLARRSILFRLLVVLEWDDGTWQSFFLNRPLSASPEKVSAGGRRTELMTVAMSASQPTLTSLHGSNRCDAVQSSQTQT